jgi:cytochrome c-type biogenesis protein CcmF
MLLVNNLLLVVMCGMVLLGTLYPLAMDAFGSEKISVGPPYFALLFNILLVPMILALPFGVFSRFKRDDFGRIARQLGVPAVIGVLAGVATFILAPDAGIVATLGIAGAGWVMAASIAWPIRRLRGKGSAAGFTRAETAMTLAHFGFGVFLVGCSLVGSINAEKHLRMQPGDRFELRGYEFNFSGMRVVQGPNYVADEGEFIVTKNGKEVARLLPQKRRYLRDGQVMTEAAIDPGLTRDVYVSLGEPLGNGEAWAVRLYYKPFVRWIWAGALLMTAAGFLAAADRRYRSAKVRAKEPLETAVAGAA